MEKKAGRELFRTSIRALVEFIFRSGDIDNRISQTDTLKAMQLGSRIHRQLQEAEGENYRAEVPLSILESYVNYDLLLEGRADGILTSDSAGFGADGGNAQRAGGAACSDEGIPCMGQVGAAIDEIKSISMPLYKLEAPIYVHLAQAKCYAYIYALQQELPAIGVRMTYVYAETEEKKKARKRREKKTGLPEKEPQQIRRFYYAYDRETLQGWFDDLISEYRKWLDYLWQWKKLRNFSAQELSFPFPYREGQKDLAAGVYRTIVHHRTLFLQAPTGTGKTMAVLFPSIKAVGQGHADRIFYLTAKTVTRQAAVNAFSILYESGLRMKYVLLTAKEKMCLCEEMVCDPDHCPYAKGHFDRVNHAVYAMLQQEECFDRQTILDAAAHYRVCPFELSLDLTDWTDVIIGDYNYVFDPQVKLKRYFADGKKGEYLFLVDEAHNLADRAREMYSAALIKEDFLQARRILKPVTRRADRLLNSVNKSLLEMKQSMEEEADAGERNLPARSGPRNAAVPASVGGLDLTLVQLAAVLDEILREYRDFKEREKVQELYFEIRRFLMILELVDENYITYKQITSEGKFLLKLLCVNPAQNLQGCYECGISTILFSATLLPIRYYMNLLSKEERPYAMYAKTSFSDDQKLLLAARDVSSKYTRRSAAEYQKAARYLLCMAEGKKGNYIAFFPSYRVMEEVYLQFEALAGDKIDAGEIELLLQKSAMKSGEREEFLNAFRAPRTGTLLAFCVMGGIFSEGIDLKGEQLIGAAIYGTGIPQINAELTLIRDYYDRRGESGFSYAYQYPGMNKVQQAAGRVIRTARDRGVILLLDDRFWRADYRKLFPREWADCCPTDLDHVRAQIADFWSRGD